MKEKHILKSIKKVVLHTTPKHLPFLEKEIFVRRKPRFWQIIPVATLAASAIVIALVSTSATPSEVNNSSSTATPSEVNSSGPNIRRPVSEMMATLDNTYTLNMVVDGLTIYEYAVAQPLIHITYFDVYMSYETQYFVDLTNAESPSLIQRYEDSTWYGSTVNPYELLSLLSPLSFIDPNLIEDDWFVWDEAMDGYGLDETYLSVLFENSPLQGVENLSIWMTASGELVIQLGGHMDENPSDYVGIQLVYSRIGSTSVTLPTDVLDVTTTVIDDLIQDSTNHRFQMTFSSTSDDPAAFPFQFQQGERSGETFKTSLYTYNLLNEDIFIDTYVSPSNDAYIKLVGTHQGYTQTTLDASGYEEALAAFYPINFLSLEESWLDLENMSYIESHGVDAYPIRDGFLDNLMNLPFNDPITDLQAFVRIDQSIYAWQGVIINFYLTLNINDLPYELFFQVSGFNRVDPIYIPYTTSIQTSLEDSLALAVGTSSYFLQQFRIDEDVNYAIDLQTVRAGDDYQLITYTNEGYLDMEYTGREGDGYVRYTFQYNQRDYVKTSIDIDTYRSITTDPQWLILDNILPGTYEPILNEPGRYDFDIDANVAAFAPSLTDQYQINDVIINYTGHFVDSPIIEFQIDATDRNTNDAVRLQATYSYLGLTDIIFPTPQDNNNPGWDDASITIETFNNLYGDGITSFFGTYYAYDDLGTFLDYDVFSFQTNEVLRVDRSLGDYVQYINNEGVYTTLTGNLTTNETTEDVIDQATFESAQEAVSLINFDAFIEENLVLLNESETFYQIKADAFGSLFHLPLPEGFELQEAYVSITKDYVYFQVFAYNETTTNSLVIYLLIEAINLDVNLLSYL
jgi:hypothetical protein